MALLCLLLVFTTTIAIVSVALLYLYVKFNPDLTICQSLCEKISDLEQELYNRKEDRSTSGDELTTVKPDMKCGGLYKCPCGIIVRARYRHEKLLWSFKCPKCLGYDDFSTCTSCDALFEKSEHKAICEYCIIHVLPSVEW